VEGAVTTQKRNQAGLTEREFLECYDPTQYERPSATVDTVIFTVTDEEAEDIRRVPDKVLRVLLIRRGDHPFLGDWALPGGFVGIDESLDDAADRKLRAETGLGDIYLEQLYTWGDVQRDPRTRVISASYMALVDATTLDLRAGEDTTDARWLTIRERTLHTRKVATESGHVAERLTRLSLSNGGEECVAELAVTRTVNGTVARIDRQIVQSNGLAFDHAKVIHYALERLRNKVEWTNIAFNLVPEFFTVKELQKVYEVILGREILDVQFRRNVDRMLIPTNQMRTNVGHRPARLFRFNPAWWGE
jgi:8-oxo-dGTP diphosphatase